MDDMAMVGLGVDSRDVRKASGDLDRFARSGDKAGGSAGRVTGAIGGMTAKMAAAAAAAAALTATFAAAIRTISEFETSISKLGAISGATTSQLEGMRDVAKQLGATTEFSAGQAADGLTFLAQAGFSAAESMAAIPAVLDLATASGLGLAAAADTASNIMSGFGIAAAEAARVSDVLAAAASSSNTNVSQLGGAMSTVAPIAAALGVNLEGTAASIGILSDAGIQGERAGTALRGVLAALAGPTSEATTALNGLGIAISDVDPATNSLSDVLVRLQGAGLSTADAMTIFGREAASGALVLVKGADQLRTFTDELGNADGAAADMADTMRDNLGGDIATMQSTLSGLILALGEAGLTAVIRGVIGTITDITRFVTGLVNGFANINAAISSMFGFANANEAIAATSAQAALAMEQEIKQADQLIGGLVEGRSYSVDYVGVKLAQAQAHLAVAEATRQENIELIKNSQVYRDAVARQAAFNADIQAYYQFRAEAAAAGEVEGRADAERYRMLVENLQNAVSVQKDLLDTVGDTAPEVRAVQTEIDYLTGLIKESSDGVVEIEGGIVQTTREAVNLSGAFTQYPGQLNAASSAAGGLSGALANASAWSATLLRNLGMVPAALQGMTGQAVSAVASLRETNASLTYQVNEGLSSTAANLKAQRDIAVSAAVANGVNIDSIAATASSYDALIAEAESLSISNDGLTTSLTAVTSAATGGGGASGAINKTADAMRDQISALEDAANPMRVYNRGMAELDALKLHRLSDGAYALAVQELTEELENAQGATDNFTQTFMDGMGRAIDYMVGGFKDGFSGLLDIIKSTLLQAAQFAIANPIKLALVNGGGVAGAAGGGGGMLSGLLGSMGGEGGIMGALTGGGGLAAGFAGLSGGAGLLGGLGSTLSATLGTGGGIGGLFSIGANAAAASGGLMATIGAALPIIGIGAAVFSFFKTKTKTIDEGIRATIDMEDAMFQSFKEIEKSRFFGLSKKRRTTFSEMSGEQSEPFQDAVFGIRESVIGATESLGVSIDVFDGFSHKFELSLKGLDEAARQAAITEEFTRMGDSLANLVPHITSMNELFAVAANRVALTDRLLQAQGKTEELTARIRAREMDATNELNKALLAQVFAAEDAAIAANALSNSINEDLFATGQDFVRAMSRTSNGQSFTPQQSDAELRAELRALNVSMERLVSTSEITAGNTGRGADAADDTLAFQLEQTL